jgi:hypothetical protein
MYNHKIQTYHHYNILITFAALIKKDAIRYKTRNTGIDI